MEQQKFWELKIIDADPPAETIDSLVAGDLDRDGHVEVVAGGAGHLMWYRPDTLEKGIIAKGRYHVGLALEDIDGDGIQEVVAGSDEELLTIYWFQPGKDLSEAWERFTIDAGSRAGGSHDLIFVDVDNDGELELIANSVFGNPWGLFLYKRTANVKAPWKQYTVQTGYSEEGLAAADLDGDGKVEIVSGTHWYRCPPGGPYAGPWIQGTVAPSFREMVRLLLVDITGNGRPDVIEVESEFPDGRMSWFENRLLENPERPWVEHPMDDILNFAHSLDARRDPKSGQVLVFVGEMMAGGWFAPYNFDARLIQYVTSDRGRTWDRTVIYQGAGVHQGFLCDVDRDGIDEVVGKQWGSYFRFPNIEIFKQGQELTPFRAFRHRFIDRDKPYTGTDIFAVDIDGDGLQDVVCGAWWYRNPSWERFTIPGIYQAINAYDIDGDGRQEVIATRKAATAGEDWYSALSSDMVWLKPIDPQKGRWEEHAVGVGRGDWPHGTLIAPLLPGGRLAMVVGYHSADEGKGHYPEIFEIPDDPKQPWPKRVLAEIPYGEEFLACDLNNDGRLDLVAGAYWLENQGDGTFKTHRIAENFLGARIGVADINRDGKIDIVAGEEVLDFTNRNTPFSRLVWFENPGNLDAPAWEMHVIDKVRCAHSIGIADLDGDGQPEIVAGEHDPFKPYRSRCRLFVYKKADPVGKSWYRYLVDGRFEHHDGAKVIELAPGRWGIISHAWTESRYVHLWELEKES